jgi:hypothetical protein
VRRALAAAALLLPAPALAADCTLATAIYRDGSSGYEIRFEPRGEDHALTETNKLRLHLPDGPILEGRIEWTSGASRPVGTIGVQCDNTSGFCTYWEGLVYELRGGAINTISGEESAPPDQILLTDLGASLFYSSLRPNYDMQFTPNDAFSFAGCTS